MSPTEVKSGPEFASRPGPRARAFAQPNVSIDHALTGDGSETFQEVPGNAMTRGLEVAISERHKEHRIHAQQEKEFCNRRCGCRRVVGCGRDRRRAGFLRAAV